MPYPATRNGLWQWVGRCRPAVFGVLLLCGCGGPPPEPEQQIRALLERGETAAEERDLGTLAELLHPEYSDTRGQDRDRLIQRLRLAFLRYRDPHLLTRVHSIDFPAPERAEVRIWLGTAAVSAGAGGWPLRGEGYDVRLSVMRNGEDWRVLHAQWEAGRPPLD